MDCINSSLIIYDETIINKIKFITQICDLCYKDPPIIKEKYNYIVISSPNSDVECYIFIIENNLYICFRARSYILDIKTDLNISFNENTFNIPKCNVHAGFFNQFLSIKKSLYEIIQIHNNVNEIILCGHCLGGGLATIAAFDIAHFFKNKKLSCFTLGSPRVGNKVFTSKFNQLIPESYRIGNLNDPVQNAPLNHKYCHVHYSIIFYNNKIIKNNDIPWYIRALIRCKNVDWFNPIKEHLMETYSHNILNYDI
jgi:predicted lipase